MRRFVPELFTGLRARLVLGFLVVVALALSLVFATLPRLLDSYFLDQTQQDLNRRTNEAGNLIALEIVRYQTSHGPAAMPILEGDPPAIAPELVDWLGNDQRGPVLEVAQQIVQANIDVKITSSADDAGTTAFDLFVPVGDEVAAPGQQREGLTSEAPSQYTISDFFWSQSESAAPKRKLIVTLSDPYTFRAQTVSQIISVMGVAGVIALIVAVIASVLIADRLSNPIRRLTGAARELSEGHLETRVAPPSSSREMGELTTAFNSMAERVQASIEYIRRDRDRSRDFLADVSHELKTPIAALRTFNELLDGQVKDPATQREFLEQSRQQIERLDWLAANLLELSKLESGLVLLDLRPDDLRAVVESAIQQAHAAADRKGVKIVSNLPDDPIRQPHDPQRMGQVIGNLLGNAIKFTPRGGEVRVTLEPTTDGAELRVADTGVGIKAAELPYVFDRFYRGAQAHESRATGSGLGLSIVRSIVEMHSGRVAISSTPGKGTQVTVDLPREVVVSSPAAVQA
jgi:two-component system sensor histidine kinase BaeS